MLHTTARALALSNQAPCQLSEASFKPRDPGRAVFNRTDVTRIRRGSPGPGTSEVDGCMSDHHVLQRPLRHPLSDFQPTGK